VQQLPPGVAAVARQGVKRQCASFSDVLLHLGHAAKLPARRIERLLRIHALTDEPLLEQGQVRPYLVVELIVQSAAPEAGGQPGQQHSEHLTTALPAAAARA
jgi:hypothetical protein